MRVKDVCGSSITEVSNISLLERRFKLFKLTFNVIDDAIVNEEAMQLVKDVLYSTQKKVLDIRGVCEVGEGSAMKVPCVHDHGIKEPFHIRAKGCGKRLKGGKEKTIKKARYCHGCGLTGQSYDKRNCPSPVNNSSQSTWLNEEDEDEVDYEDLDEYLDEHSATSFANEEDLFSSNLIGISNSSTCPTETCS
ncbi:hypothetical protein Dimus_000476 [Dionaea muscipula]